MVGQLRPQHVLIKAVTQRDRKTVLEDFVRPYMHSLNQILVTDKASILEKRIGINKIKTQIYYYDAFKAWPNIEANSVIHDLIERKTVVKHKRK